MIVSHRYRFIFIKTRKTAGTSVEIALSKYCGPDDIVTEIEAEDEALRRRLGYRGPQNHRKPLHRYGAHDWWRLVRARRRAVRYWNHMGFRDVRRLVPAEVWNGYFKFCFERNPWSKALSFYH